MQSVDKMQTARHTPHQRILPMMDYVGGSAIWKDRERPGGGGLGGRTPV